MAERFFQIGLDFGTCWTKIVARDYDHPRRQAFVVRALGTDSGPEEDFRIPSAVTLVGRKLHFGWPGRRRAKRPGAKSYSSVKMRAAFPDNPLYCSGPVLPPGLMAEDLPVLAVTYALQVAKQSIEDHCSRLRGQPTPVMGMCLGAPMSMAGDERLRALFLRVARDSYEWFRDATAPQLTSGIELKEAIRQLAKVRSVTRSRPLGSERDWLRSEAEAGLLWVFQSPQVPAGRYTCIDIGAGTTDVSVFRIVQQFVPQGGIWQKGVMRYYSAASSTPGVDALREALLEIAAPSEVAMRAISRHDYDGCLRIVGSDSASISSVADGMFGVFQAAWRAAFAKYRRVWNQSGQGWPSPVEQWEGMRVFVLGGGAKVTMLRDRIARSPWDGQVPDPGFIKAEHPKDLVESNGSPLEADPDFLLVAYGLSFVGQDVPPVEAPRDGVPYEPLPSRPQRQDLSGYYAR